MFRKFFVKSEKSLLRDKSGVIALLFALELVPLIGAMGLALDGSRYFELASTIKFAMDSGGLAAGTLTCSPCDQNAVQQQEEAVAQAYFNANYGGSDIKLQFPGIGNGTLTIKTDATYPATLTGVLGIPSLALPTQTAYALPGNIDIALALDNTGSMTQSFGPSATPKIVGLKQGAQAFVDYMKGLSATTLNHIKISIVPFTTDINLGKLGANMLGLVQFDKPMVTITVGTNIYSFNEPDAPTIPLLGNYGDFARCQSTNESDKNHCYDAKIYTSTFGDWPHLDFSGTYRACVMSRNEAGENGATQFWNTASGAAPITETAGLYAADGVNCYFQTQGVIPMQPLLDVRDTANYKTLSAKISSMVAGGATDLTLGLAWGWNMVTPGAPLSQSVSNANVYRYVIFFTDGENTMTRHHANIYYPPNSDSDAMNQQTKNICKNIKADNNQINLYTIGPNSNDVTVTNLALLQECASPGDAYAYNTADDLTPIFQTIASNIANLHVVS